MAGEPDRRSQDPSSVLGILGRAFEPLQKKPVLSLTLAFGILVVGGAGALQTRGTDRVTLFVVIGVLVLVFVIGLIAGREAGRGSGAATESPSRAPQGTTLRVVIGDRSKVEMDNTLNVAGAGADAVGGDFEVGNQAEVTLKDAMNRRTDTAG